MSRQNVEVVRRLGEGWNESGFQGLSGGASCTRAPSTTTRSEVAGGEVGVRRDGGGCVGEPADG